MEYRNWREHALKEIDPNQLDWQVGLYKEYIHFIDTVTVLAERYDWDIWCGGAKNYSVRLTQPCIKGKYIALRILPSFPYSYYASFSDQMNPNQIEQREYQTFVGKTVEDALLYLERFLKQNSSERNPAIKPSRQKDGCYEYCKLHIQWALEAYLGMPL